MKEPKPIHVQLREARKRLKLTQAGLAKRAYMKQSDISQLENGKDVRLSTLRRVAMVMELQIHIVDKFQFMGEIEDEHSPIFERYEVKDD